MWLASWNTSDSWPPSPSVSSVSTITTAPSWWRIMPCRNSRSNRVALRPRELGELGGGEHAGHLLVAARVAVVPVAAVHARHHLAALAEPLLEQRDLVLLRHLDALRELRRGRGRRRGPRRGPSSRAPAGGAGSSSARTRRRRRSRWARRSPRPRPARASSPASPGAPSWTTGRPPSSAGGRRRRCTPPTRADGQSHEDEPATGGSRPGRGTLSLLLAMRLCPLARSAA